ncbi:MAG TPA: hypothetical protein VGY58_10595 [Gemmataceae bacterium]|nr:hypothetical protein [Gemmataceae bacterium]
MAAAQEPVVIVQPNPQSEGSKPLAVDATRAQAVDQLFAEVASNGLWATSLEGPIR